MIAQREPRRTPKAGKPQSLKHKEGESTSQANREQLPSQDELTTQAELPIEPDLGTSERLARSLSAQPHVQEVRTAPKRVRSEAHKKAQREKQAKIRAERNSLGLCRDCGQPRPEGQTRCHDCVTRHSRYWETYVAKGRTWNFEAEKTDP